MNVPLIRIFIVSLSYSIYCPATQGSAVNGINGYTIQGSAINVSNGSTTQRSAINDINGSTINWCKFNVSQKSAEYFRKWLKIVDGMFAHLQITFNDNKTYNATNEVLFPTKWIWTFVPPGGGRFYISWPVDYTVFSFGLLDTHTLGKDVIMFLDAYPEDCAITFGGNQTVENLAQAMYEMSINYNFSLINDFYEYSYWCYMSEHPNFNNSLLRDLNRYLGVPTQMFGYRCCNNSLEQKRSMCEAPDDKFNPYQLLPYYIGIIFFSFYPVFLIRCGLRSVDAGKPLHVTGYTEMNDDNEFIFMKKRGPVSVAKLLLGIFGLADKHPLIASRIRRALFVCFAPVVVYIFVIIYAIQNGELMDEMVKHGIPTGFVSVLGGFNESMDLFLPMFGGPAISLILYIIIGLFIMLMPRDIGEILNLGLPPDKQKFGTLLKLDLETIEKFSKKECNSRNGYRKMYSVLRGNVYLMINPKFWYFMLLFYLRRWEPIMENINWCCSKKIFKLMIGIPTAFLYTCICIFETALFLLYHGLPICFFVFSIVRGYAKYLRQTQSGQSFFIYIFSIIVPICFMFYVFMLVMITVESFTIICYFIYFLYLSLVIFPDRAFGFVYYVIMFILYVNSLMNRFQEDYKELLNSTINGSIKLEKARIAKEYLSRVPNVSTNQHAMDFIAITNEIPFEMVPPSPLNIQCLTSHKYIKYRKQIPGVKKELFQYIIERNSPIHISFFHMIVQILVVQVLALASIVFISTYIKNVQSRESSEVLNVMTIIIVTMIPNLFRLFFVHPHDKNIRKRKVRQNVIEFWRERENEEQVD